MRPKRKAPPRSRLMADWWIIRSCNRRFACWNLPAVSPRSLAWDRSRGGSDVAWDRRSDLAVWTCLLVCAFATYPSIAGAQSHVSQAGSEQTLQEVTVTAIRLQDHR